MFNLEDGNTITTTLFNGTKSSPKRGYYDAEKCRTHIANQTRVSKIDRFVVQINNVKEVEMDIHDRLCEISNLYKKQINPSIKDFIEQCGYPLTDKCKGNESRLRKSKITYTSSLLDGKIGNSLKTCSIPNLKKASNHSTNGIKISCSNNDPNYQVPQDVDESKDEAEDELSEEESKQLEHFDFKVFSSKLNDYFGKNRRKSDKILGHLRAIKQIFEQLASEHRLNVDLVYAAEEERQSASVIRRSAYNLSMAAIKATSTPVHVKTGSINP